MAMELDDPNFEPSTQTKRFWLYVRKPGFDIDGDPFPGLFEISDYTRDRLFFVLAIALEIWSMFMILSVGTIPILYQVALVATAMFVDISLAIYFHFYEGRILLRKNETIAAEARYTPPQARAARAAYARHIRRYHILRLIPAALIVAFAICKSAIYVMLQRETNILTISVVVAYILIAVIHLNNTGYFCYAFVGEWLFLRPDKRRFQNIHDKTHNKANVTAVTHGFEYIYTNTELVPTRFPDSRGEHLPPESFGLERGLPNSGKVGADAKYPDYTLFTWGVFTDQQLQAVSHAQMVKEKKLLVASHGVSRQLSILFKKPQVAQDDGALNIESAPPANERVANKPAKDMDIRMSSIE